ncbi:MAG: hypothetical protein RLP14_00485 [Owenweeksia sp.]
MKFEVNNYLDTAPDKHLFFKEMYRDPKPGGKLLIVDYYKPFPYVVWEHTRMYNMLYHWAISDILPKHIGEAWYQAQSTYPPQRIRIFQKSL